MKKLLVLLCTLGLAQPALAASISTLGNLGQAEFKTLSEDLGAALSYKPVTPAAPLGTIGFDVGVEVTQTDTTKSAQIWSKATGNGSTVSKVYVPKLHVAKGLPFGIDVAAFYSKIPTTNISLVGAELRYAIMEGGLTMPAIAVRGAFTKLGGVDQLSLDTKSLDVSISKGFAILTPYAGVGQVWVNSKANVTGLSGVTLSDTFTQSKVFVGANLNLGITNIAAEIDKTGGIQSASLKLGIRF
jgi:hypothetical protein